jgi:molecular chaperone GrpE
MSEKEKQEELQETENVATQPKEENKSEEEATAQSQESTDEQTPVEQLAEENEQLKAKYEESKDKYLRLLAEFENFKKRTIREKMEFMKSAAQDTLTALLPVLDDFDRAKKAAESNDKGELFEEGIGLVYQKLYNTLQQKGLKPMDSDGQPFDPELHEAFTEIPAPSDALKGHVVDTIEKGYFLNEKIIRHAKVVVGK